MSEPLKLDLGCGGRGTMYPDQGFIGVDKHPEPPVQRKPGATYIQLDFVHATKLPWKPGTVSEIVCFHVVEHLDPYAANGDHAEVFLRRAYELLMPGGKMYVTTPDLAFFVDKYLDGHVEFWNRTYPSGKAMWPGRTVADKFSYAVYDGNEHGHRRIFDLESLTELARAAGCENIEPLPDPHEWRRRDHECGIIVTK